MRAFVFSGSPIKTQASNRQLPAASLIRVWPYGVRRDGGTAG